jgi:hypothetical protein
VRNGVEILALQRSCPCATTSRLGRFNGPACAPRRRGWGASLVPIGAGSCLCLPLAWSCPKRCGGVPPQKALSLRSPAEYGRLVRPAPPACCSSSSPASSSCSCCCCSRCSNGREQQRSRIAQPAGVPSSFAHAGLRHPWRPAEHRRPPSMAAPASPPHPAFNRRHFPTSILGRRRRPCCKPRKPNTTTRSPILSAPAGISSSSFQ